MIKPSILILEDEPLIAMDLEDLLFREGYENVTTVSSCDAAKRYLSAATPNLTILDVHLRDGDSAEIGRTLFERDAPFIVMSGSERADVDAVFQNCPWIAKPFESDITLIAIKEALTGDVVGRDEDRSSASTD